MARICAFVFNSVTRDARVIKEANSLVSAGHDVTIIGIADNNFPEERATLETGVEILRVPKVVGSGESRLRFFASFLKKIKRNIDIIFLILVFIYFSIYPSLLQVQSVFDWLLTSRINTVIFWAGAVYLALNISRVINIAFAVTRISLQRLLGKEKIKATSDIIVNRLKAVAPKLFRAEIESRAQQRIEQMVRLAHSFSPDIVHCHDIHTLPAGAAIKDLIGCRVVYDAHEIYEEVAQSNAAASKRYRAMHRKYLPFIDGFITINESIAAWYKENYPQIPEPVIVMNATVRTAPFDYDGRLHKATKLPDGQKIILYQGGYAQKRGLERLVRSAAFLPSDWTLVMMGWGRLEPELKAIAAEITVAGGSKRGVASCEFLPPVPQSELPYWSAGATVGVIPYENVGLNHWFCTPNKLWEYPNAGVPILVSPFPELRKQIEKYGHGWLLPENITPRIIAEQVANFEDAEIARARKACTAFCDAEEWSKYASRLIKLYEGITGVENALKGS